MLRLLRKRLLALQKLLKMNSDGKEKQNTCTKRPNDTEISNEQNATASKVPKLLGIPIPNFHSHITKDDARQPNAERKRKIALLLLYSGAGYHGLQINRDVSTIEGDLMAALVKCGFILPSHAEDMSQICFQRASRTDKGVSAVGQVVSFKMPIHHDNLIARINENLPEQIRAVGYKRTTKGFNSKNYCDARTYIYLLPTYALSPFTETVTEDYRITDAILKETNEILTMFMGTHNFHNFTSHVKSTERTALRYMIHLELGKPFLRDNIEWAVITIKGQSFMLHHIRKMIGLTVAVVRGFAQRDIFDKVFGPEKMDVPKVPGLGLVLDQLHYDGYNKRYGNDGIHEPLDWTEYKDVIEDFKDKQIFKNIIKTEKEEHPMMMWLSNLHHHTYDYKSLQTSRQPLAIAQWKVDNPDKVRGGLEISNEYGDTTDNKEASNPDRADTTCHVEPEADVECATSDVIITSHDSLDQAVNTDCPSSNR